MAKPSGKERGEKETVVLPVRLKEVEQAPSFAEFCETEYDGDYTAARTAYMRRYRVDPSSAVVQLR